MKSSGLLVIIIVLFLCGTAYAERTVWYVHPDSNLNTIQSGLDSCANNDIVLVGPGTYYENIIWPNTQGIHLVSELGPAETIIDGDNVGIVIRCNEPIGNIVIQDFTIQNGWGALAPGVGICISNNLGSVNITGNIVTNNVSPPGVHAAGIHTWASGTVTNNTIFSNIGPGIRGGLLEIRNNIITDNTDFGILVSGGSSIEDNYIANNGGFGIGQYIGYDIQDFRNTDISNNALCGSRTCGEDIITNNTDRGILNYPIPSLTITVKNTVVTHNNHGINCFGGSTIDSCTVTNNYGCGIAVYYTASPGGGIHHCNIFGNVGYGVWKYDTATTIIDLDAEYNWWGDATGPYHPIFNLDGLGDLVSDYVDFNPWLTAPVGVEEQPIIKPIETHENLTATIFRGPLQLPKDKKCKVFDITGRVVEPDKITRGIYFIEVDEKIVQKVIKIR